MHLLGNPDYIQLLVNPDQRIIALRPGNANDLRSHYIDWSLQNSKRCYEIYSKDLILRLSSCLIVPYQKNILQIQGQIIPSENVALFSAEQETPSTVQENTHEQTSCTD